MNRAPQFTLARFCCFAILLYPLLGCEISYKRGASPSTMASDEKACRSKHDTTAAYQNCMKELGWFISTADPSPQFAALRSENKRDLSVEELKNEMQSETKSAAPIIEQEAKTLAVKKPTATSDSPQALPSQPEPATAPPVEQKAERLKKPTKISSWWKFGGSAQQLDSDQEKCRAALDEPVGDDKLTVSNAMYVCMRKLGWFGI